MTDPLIAAARFLESQLEWLWGIKFAPSQSV